MERVPPEFAANWARHQVRDCGHAVREYRHPLVGDLVLAEEVLRVQDDSGLRLLVLSPEPGSASAERLALLASLAAATVDTATAVGEHPCATTPGSQHLATTPGSQHLIP